MNKPTTLSGTTGQAALINNSKLNDLRHLLEKRKGAIGAVIAQNMSPDRLIKIALVAASRNPKLLNCSGESIFRSLMDATQLNLEPFTGLDLCYIIPYTNRRNGTTEAQFQISARGLCELARRSGIIQSLTAQIIYEHDKFEIEMGLNEKLVHVPNYTDKERGRAILVYAIAKFKDGGHEYEVMTVGEIEAIRARSQSPNAGPWVDYWGQMARKTILKRLCKRLPMAAEIAKAIAKDDAAESGQEILDIDSVDTSTLSVGDDVVTNSVNRADEIIEKLGGSQ